MEGHDRTPRGPFGLPGVSLDWTRGARCYCLPLLFPALQVVGCSTWRVRRRQRGSPVFPDSTIIAHHHNSNQHHHRHNQHFLAGVSGNSRSRSFPRMKASDSLPEFREWFFFIPFPFPNFGNVFFHSLPVPEFWEWIFSFPSRSQTLGMEIFHSLPVPELTISKSGIKRENGRL